MKKFRKIVIVAFVLIGIIAYGVRVKAINSDLKLSEVKTYDKGEKVPFEKDFFDTSENICEGYAIKVLDKHIYTKEEFEDKYDVKVRDGLHNDYLYTVDVKIYNDNENLDEEHGINCLFLSLKSSNAYELTDIEFTVKINSLPNIKFSLKPKSDKDITLVYSLSDIYYENIEEIEDTDFKLMITEYPVKKLLCFQ